MKFATKAIHQGYDPDAITGAIMPPIYMTSTYLQEAPGVTKGFDYTRADNPNFRMLEGSLAALEEATYATVFSSGLGALTALMATGKQGDRIAVLDGLYGGTYRLLHAVFSRFGIEVDMIKVHEIHLLEKAFEKKPKWFLFETPTNPLLDIFDIKACVKVAQQYDVMTIVDNTFASPYFQNPLKLGADVSWHSLTKYIGGHSDVIGGAMATNNSTIKQKLDFMRKSLGVNPSPFDAWLIMRGIKTLALRMEKHQNNALQIAHYLEGHPKVLRVYYPGLESHPKHLLAQTQMSGFSGIVSVEFNLSLELTKKLISSFMIFSLAESLGGVESLVCHPATMTHASIPTEERLQMGIGDALIRFSVGIEDCCDLIDDLSQGLELIS